MRDSDSDNKNNTQTVGEALKAMLKDYHLQQKYEETRLITSWEQLVGKTIAGHTEKVYIRDKALCIVLDSAPLRHELKMARSKLLKNLQDEFGADVITSIRIS